MKTVSLTRREFDKAFVGLVGLASACALVALSAISSACQTVRVGLGSDKGSEIRRKEGTAASRPQDGLSQPVNTARPTGGKPADLFAATAGVAVGSPGSRFERSASALLGEGSGPSAQSGSLETYEVTAYSHGCIMPRKGKEGHARRAANGRWPVADVTVAADTSIHPFGTELLIEGLGFRSVGDRGHVIKGRRLDLFVDTCREAREFGRQWLTVWAVPDRSAKYAQIGGGE